MDKDTGKSQLSQADAEFFGILLVFGCSFVLLALFLTMGSGGAGGVETEETTFEVSMVEDEKSVTVNWEIEEDKKIAIAVGGVERYVFTNSSGSYDISDVNSAENVSVRITEKSES